MLTPKQTLAMRIKNYLSMKNKILKTKSLITYIKITVNFKIENVQEGLKHYISVLSMVFLTFLTATFIGIKLLFI